MDEIIERAVNYYNRKWPVELVSGIMFFEGKKITRKEFTDFIRKN